MTANLYTFSKINGHGHLLPYPEQIPAFMRQKKYFWIDEQREFMHQDSWSRPITDASFFLNEKLTWMAECGIEHEVILNLSQLYCNGVNQADTLDILHFQNDFNAQVQADHEQSFTTGFVVQPAYIDQALKEINRCVNELGMQLLCLSTHYLSSDGQWLSVADESVDPIWQLANELGLAIEIHPYDAGKLVQLKEQYWSNHLVWMMAQTADTFHKYAMRGLAIKFPNVRTCFAHGAMLSHANPSRVEQGRKGRPDLFPGAYSVHDTLKATNVFYDTLVHDTLTLDLMLKRVGSSQIVWGVDDPYPLGEMATVKGCYPGILLDEMVDQSLLNVEQAKAIMSRNVARWIAPK